MAPQEKEEKNLCGGRGSVYLRSLLSDGISEKCSLYAQVTIPAGCSIGYHEHHGESETYYLLSGSGVYSDNGLLRVVKKGDKTFTPDGKGHALTNTGDEDLVIMALILRD